LPGTVRRRLIRTSYRNFVRTMLDLFWAQNLTPEKYRHWLKLEGFEALPSGTTAARAGRSSSAFTRAISNGPGLACGFEGFGNCVVAENFKNPLLDEVFNRLRQVSGRNSSSRKFHLRLLKTVNAAARRDAARSQLRPPKPQRSSKASAQDVRDLSHALLAQRAARCLCRSRPIPGRWHLPGHRASARDGRPGRRSRKSPQRCWNAWSRSSMPGPAIGCGLTSTSARPKNADRPYPFYANESGKFEKLLRSRPRKRLRNNTKKNTAR